MKKIKKFAISLGLCSVALFSVAMSLTLSGETKDVEAATNLTFERCTTADLPSGRYLIVYENTQGSYYASNFDNGNNRCRYANKITSTRIDLTKGKITNVEPTASSIWNVEKVEKGKYLITTNENLTSTYYLDNALNTDYLERNEAPNGGLTNQFYWSFKYSSSRVLIQNYGSSTRSISYYSSNFYCCLKNTGTPAVLYKCTIDLYKVSFDLQGHGSDIDSQSIESGSKVTKPDDPSETGYTFGGWFKESTCTNEWDFSTDTVTQATTLYAKWTNNDYTITYKDKGGNSFSGTHESGYPTSHNYGTDTTLKTATKTGFIFGGWFTSSDCSGSAITSLGSTSYTDNITLYALWTEDTSYKPTLVKSIGGYIKENGTKKQFIAFGFQVSSTVYNSLTNDSDFGIVAYKAGSSQTEYSNGTISSLKTNEGRFYLYMIVDSQTPITYYAKAFVKYSGAYIYSSLVDATGDLSGTQYTID